MEDTTPIVIDLGNHPARLTWQALEQLCELLRKHHRVTVQCGFDPFASHLITDVLPLRVESKET